MSFACSKQKCVILAEMQCTCPQKLRFCKNHILEHTLSTNCDIKNIVEKLKQAQGKLNETKQILTCQKENILATALDMISRINKMLNISLGHINSKINTLNFMMKSCDTQNLSKITEGLNMNKYSKYDFISSIDKYLRVFEPHVILSDLSLEDKKKMLIDFEFEGFQDLTKNEALTIDNIQATLDGKYIFLCELYFRL
ncbi:hypothetical protein SteCoe_2865 [Stentor coeruleus]|uniref:Uncharacterized protein n=1 Tax=Stentor coeruleus TaxID=5963 RepID=A0A1R2CYM2_9CILI|nr:hypothetical protein SteCoe_2865 [Stentor coeruleus]